MKNEKEDTNMIKKEVQRNANCYGDIIEAESTFDHHKISLENESGTKK